jgi:uncharacterized membrane protein YgcG
MSLDALKTIGQAKQIGEILQRDFTGDWLVATAKAALRRVVWDAIREGVDRQQVAYDLKISADDADRVIAAVFSSLRRQSVHGSTSSNGDGRVREGSGNGGGSS